MVPFRCSDSTVSQPDEHQLSVTISGCLFLPTLSIIYSCIGMGLHRRASPLQERTLSRYTLEMRKRIFWTA